MRGFLFACIFTLASTVAHARVEVAFFEITARNGQTIELEKGGRFAHVAIKIGGRWLHADPISGVSWLGDISNFKNTVILASDAHEDLVLDDVVRYVGRRYDSTFNWNDSESTYCSKLVANLLEIQPTPMRFSGSYWDRRSTPERGELGISPDELFTELIEMGYSATHEAASVFTCFDLISRNF